MCNHLKLTCSTDSPVALCTVPRLAHSRPGLLVVRIEAQGERPKVSTAARPLEPFLRPPSARTLCALRKTQEHTQIVDYLLEDPTESSLLVCW